MSADIWQNKPAAAITTNYTNNGSSGSSNSNSSNSNSSGNNSTAYLTQVAIVPNVVSVVPDIAKLLDHIDTVSDPAHACETLELKLKLQEAEEEENEELERAPPQLFQSQRSFKKDLTLSLNRSNLTSTSPSSSTNATASATAGFPSTGISAASAAVAAKSTPYVLLSRENSLRGNHHLLSSSGPAHTHSENNLIQSQSQSKNKIKNETWSAVLGVRKDDATNGSHQSSSQQLQLLHQRQNHNMCHYHICRLGPLSSFFSPKPALSAIAKVVLKTAAVAAEAALDDVRAAATKSIDVHSSSTVAATDSATLYTSKSGGIKSGLFSSSSTAAAGGTSQPIKSILLLEDNPALSVTIDRDTAVEHNDQLLTDCASMTNAAQDFTARLKFVTSFSALCQFVNGVHDTALLVMVRKI
jgi:hypothetical protein